MMNTTKKNLTCKHGKPMYYKRSARKYSAPALAGEMGHGSTKMIFEHYRALVLKKDAKAFWNITPLA